MEFSGEITNLTGVEFSFAKFEITLYDANRRILDTGTVFIISVRRVDICTTRRCTPLLNSVY